MPKSLIIVESPAKARTIRKYLGSSFSVKATLGHIKDLPRSKMGVAVDKGFIPEYQVIPGKRKVLDDIIKTAGTVDTIYLALDPDREGEAIAWHIAEELGKNGADIQRVLFNEITKKGVAEGLGNPQQLNVRRFESQQARRILDRLVGYELSPVLWRKVRRGLSAGRVQSVAVRLVLDREREIAAFVPEEYWKIEAHLAAADPPPFVARYHGREGKKVEVKKGEAAARIKEEAQDERFVVEAVERKERRRAALPPFITSRLQQEMARRFRFSAKRTMTVAQQLYEGVDLGEEGTVGLITYMRTDSVRLSADAVTEARQFIEQRYGKQSLPPRPNVFKSRKGSQDAHEAIRPTSVEYLPERVGKYLTVDQRKLYRAVWERFVACQMAPAVYDQTTVTVAAGTHRFRAAGSVIRFRGWLEAIGEGDAPRDNGQGGEDDTKLPPLEPGAVLDLVEPGVVLEQKFTQPPPRFNEGTLIRELEERGIGRPSTYASILSTIQDRRYVVKDEGRLKPSELGEIVTDRLVLHFPRVLDVDFTASMEDSLDEIESGKQDWVALLGSFYTPFHEEVMRALKEMQDMRGLAEDSGEICELCGNKMMIKWGRHGKFMACSGYPACRNTREIGDDGKRAALEPVDVKCEECGEPMVRKVGRFGEFLTCSTYPKCKTTRPMPTGIFCPRQGCAGELVERRTKRGRVFHGCSAFKATGCDFVVWGQPAKEPCPQCAAAFLVATKRRGGGRQLKCAAEGCGYSRTETGES